MTKRAYFGPGRLILSKPGFTAAPGLGENGKIFDSDWLFAHRIVVKGFLADPSPPSRDPNKTSSSASFTIPLPYSVAEQLKLAIYPVLPSMYNSNTDFVGGVNNVRVVSHATYLEFQRRDVGSGLYSRSHFFYWVYSA